MIIQSLCDNFLISAVPSRFWKGGSALNILIVGAGKVGSTLAAYLSREDHNVTIIDQNDTAIHRASDTLDVMCIKGPGRRSLRAAGGRGGGCRSGPGHHQPG